MNLSEQLNIGIIGEHLTIAHILSQGYGAFQTSQGMPYDLILDTGKKLLKIQVKTTSKMRSIKPKSRPIYFFSIRKAGKGQKRFYKKGDFDAYAFVGLDKKVIMYLPFDACNSNSVCIRDRNTEYFGRSKGGVKNGFYYQDLTLKKLIENI